MGLFLSLLTTLFYILGFALIVPGLLSPEYYSSGSLLSVPLYPTKEDGICEYVGAIPNKNSSYSTSRPQNININFPLYQFNNLKKKQSVYIIHNLWGYNFNLTASSATFGSSPILYNYHNFNRNSGDNRSLDIEISDEFHSINRIIPSQFTFKKKCYFIYCPVSTLITKDLNIEPECNTNYGAMASLKNYQYWQYLKVGEISFKSLPTKITFSFSNLTVNPMDYIFTPAMFLATWKKTNSESLTLAGTVFIYLAILFNIVDLIKRNFVIRRVTNVEIVNDNDNNNNE